MAFAARPNIIGSTNDSSGRLVTVPGSNYLSLYTAARETMKVLTNMTQRVSQIKEYWDMKAERLGTDPSATMKDVILRSLEIEAIGSRLFREDRLIDVGCGNAFGSLAFAKRCESVLAVDYSGKMVAIAKDAIAASGRPNIRADEGDVLKIASAHPREFTAASCVRCLINLPTKKQQYRALSQLADLLVSGGRLFLIEGVAQHFAAMNKMRRQLGLEMIPLDWHNTLFNKAALEKEISRHFSIEEVVDFGDYYFLSRVVHPLVVAPDQPMFQGKVNQVARTIWQKKVATGRFSFMSTLVLYVCHRY